MISRSKPCILAAAPLIAPITPLSILNADLILSINAPRRSPIRSCIKQSAVSSIFSSKSLSIPFIKSSNSSKSCLNKQDTKPPTSLSCFLTALSKSGSGTLILSRPSRTRLFTSSITTPFILAVMPFILD